MDDDEREPDVDVLRYLKAKLRKLKGFEDFMWQEKDHLPIFGDFIFALKVCLPFPSFGSGVGVAGLAGSGVEIRSTLDHLSLRSKAYPLPLTARETRAQPTQTTQFLSAGENRLLLFGEEGWRALPQG